MTSRNSADARKAPEGTPDAEEGLRLVEANINPATGLATDYLNHFSEAVMLLDMLASCPEFRTEFLAWKPVGYRQHFRASQFKARELAIAAYDTADPHIRSSFDALAVTMSVVLEATRAAMANDLRPQTIVALAENATGWLKPLIARAGAVINGEANDSRVREPQAVVDGLMKR
jgi:hypothetical protein